jgi:hypothetical protein
VEFVRKKNGWKVYNESKTYDVLFGFEGNRVVRIGNIVYSDELDRWYFKPNIFIFFWVGELKQIDDFMRGLK